MEKYRKIIRIGALKFLFSALIFLFFNGNVFAPANDWIGATSINVSTSSCNWYNEATFSDGNVPGASFYTNPGAGRHNLFN
jgi:hypothetical protein